jgi:hypothetical protein
MRRRILRGMHRNALLHILADLEQRISFCEAELAYRRAYQRYWSYEFRRRPSPAHRAALGRRLLAMRFLHPWERLFSRVGLVSVVLGLMKMNRN